MCHAATTFTLCLVVPVARRLAGARGGVAEDLLNAWGNQ